MQEHKLITNITIPITITISTTDDYLDYSNIESLQHEADEIGKAIESDVKGFGIDIPIESFTTYIKRYISMGSYTEKDLS